MLAGTPEQSRRAVLEPRVPAPHPVPRSYPDPHVRFTALACLSLQGL